MIEAEGVPITGIETIYEADLLYRGQSHVMRVPVKRPFDPADVLKTSSRRAIASASTSS